ncbi:MAG: hypothetical protein M3257_00060 [Actinomycetota bacterium]|nr:hypothetical protein [Actinomycetota bacterium]
MTAPAGLVSVQLSTPVTWASLPVTDPELGWVDRTAALLADADDVRAELAAILEQARPELLTEPLLALAVWVPDRSVSAVTGLLTVDWIEPDEGRALTRDYYRSLIDPDRRRGHTAFGRAVDDVEVPAGPALLVQEVISRPDRSSFPARSKPQENVIYTVFPPGCREAIELTFATPALHLGDALAADAATVVETLRVNLDLTS